MVQKVFKARWIMVIAVLSALISSPAIADDFTAAVEALNAKSYSEKGSAIEALVATGDNRATVVLGALLQGDLFVRKSDDHVVVGKKSGSVYVLTDPVAGLEVGEAAKADLKKIRINNRLRGQLKGLLGAMTLMSEDPAKRMSGADEVFKANDPGMLPILEKAIAREFVGDVKDRMMRARAAIILEYSKDSDARVAAAHTLETFTDPEVAALLGKLAFMDDAGQPVEQDPAVFAAVQTAHKSVESQLAKWPCWVTCFKACRWDQCCFWLPLASPLRSA